MSATTISSANQATSTAVWAATGMHAQSALLMTKTKKSNYRISMKEFWLLRLQQTKKRNKEKKENKICFLTCSEAI
jgi:hypothetical protein